MQDNKFVLYVMNDTHYVSKKMWEEGDPINNREKGDCVCIKDTPEVLNSFFDKIIEDETSDAVLIIGDLINNGDVQSHTDFRHELERLVAAGKRVFVTTATHDYNGKKKDENFFNAVRYTKDGTEPAEWFYKTDLPEFYADYGIGKADSVHAESGSYSVLLMPGLRLVAINDNGNGRSHCGLFEDGVNWLKNELGKARDNGEAVYCCVHHPVIPPWPVYQRAADFELYGGYAEMREILCEYGVKIIFTGHTHVHGIRKYCSEKCGEFYDVATASLAAAYGSTRRVVFDPETKTCDITSVGIETIRGVDTHGLSAREYLYGLNFTGLVEKAFPLAYTDWEKFVASVKPAFNVKLLEEHKVIAKFAVRKVGRATLRVPAKIAGKYAALTKAEKAEARETQLREVAFTIMRHIFSGNAPYTPDTVVYKVLMGDVYRFVSVAGKFGVDTFKLMKELTPEELVAPFLSAAARTGDDDNLTVKYDV